MLAAQCASVFMCASCVCARAREAVGVAPATSPPRESVAVCANMRPERPDPRALSLCAPPPPGSGNPGGKPLDPGVGAHLDLSVLIYPCCAAVFQIRHGFPKTRTFRAKTGAWTGSCRPSFLNPCSSAAVKPSVLCTLIGKRQFVNALEGTFQQNGYLKKRKKVANEIIPFICPQWLNYSLVLFRF